MHNEATGLRVRPQGWSRLVYLAVGLLVVAWLFNTPAGLLGKADAVGYAVCHRIELRSFHLHDRPLPLCARCSGMYLGAVLGLAFQAVTARRRSGLPPKALVFALGGLVLAFIIDGGNSFLSLIPFIPHPYETFNWTRLLTGTGMGLVIAAALFPAFNQTAWLDHDPRPALASWRSLGVLVLLALGVDALVLTENPVILYPLALISAAGVLLILTTTYTMLWLMAFHRENQARSWLQLALPVATGFGAALLQIALLDLARFWLTGTWQGFTLG